MHCTTARHDSTRSREQSPLCPSEELAGDIQEHEMKHRIAVLSAAAVLATLPVIASAATLNHDTPKLNETIFMNGPSISAGDDDVMDIMNAEHSYLSEVCPAVRANPGGYSATLTNFCGESHL
jgi:hypothetical protein